MGYLETAKASLEAIRTRPADGETPIVDHTEAPSRATSPQPDLELERITSMSLDEFARAGLKVRVHSRVLGCDVLFISDNVADGDIDPKGLTFYRAHELRKLAVLKPQPHSLRTIHEVKAVFGGVIEEISHG